MSKEYRVLFVCTGNAGRSIMAESILNRLGAGRFHAFSAGSNPASRVHPFAIEELARRDYPIAGLRSKSWSEFAAPGTEAFDFIIWVCDLAADQKPPVWQGQPTHLWWHFPPPGAQHGSVDDIRNSFAQVCDAIETSLKNFVLLPVDEVDVDALASMAKCIPVQRHKRPPG